MNSYKLLFRVFVILFFVITIGRACYDDFTIDNKPVNYSIGLIIDFKRGAKVAPRFEYEFYVNEKRYTGRYSIVQSEVRNMENNLIKEHYLNKKFFVKFNEDSPSINRLMLDFPVPENVEPQPLGGWDELPKN